ncbi:MAG: calcium-binding protein [Paracoccaceae bacterium]
MAMRIYLEAKSVAVGSVNAWGHMYLVLRDDALPYEQAADESLVIRGGPSAGALDIEANNFLLKNSTDNYDDGTPRLLRPSIDITDLIPLGAAAWGSLEQTALGLVGLYDYEILSSANDREHVSNSNATILTVLASVGVDVRDINTQSPYWTGYPGANTLNGTLLGVDNDAWIDASSSMNDDIVLYGRDDFDDKMKGTNGNDYFYGRGGDDEVFWGQGNDIIYGDDGNDTYNIAQSQSAVDMVLTAALDVGEMRIEAGVNIGSQSILAYSVEKYILTENSDTVYFSGDFNAFSSLSNLSSIEIDAGLSGENGDTLDLSDITSTGEITIDLSGANGATITQGNTTVSNLKGFENVIGSAQNDVITGDLSGNALFGNDGDDEIDGGAGHDDIHGGKGNDTIDGGKGADFIYDNGAEQPFQAGDDLSEYLDNLLAYDGGLDAENNPTGNDVINGGDGSDKIFYSGGQDTINSAECMEQLAA